MADVRAFRGLRYDLTKAGDFAALVCPPYDLINPEQQKALEARSPYNAVHVELPSDVPGQDRYARAAETWRRWREERVVVPEGAPSYYLLRQRFPYQGGERARLGLFARVRLEEFERGIILPHEHTTPAPKKDRLALMEACRANFSPLMVLYRDPRGDVRKALEEAARARPTVSAPDHDGHPADFWALSDPALVRHLESAFKSWPLYIADGHHRYETALLYRDQMRERLGKAYTGREAFNYVMLSLTDFADPGLVVMPYHRLLTGIGAPQTTRIREPLKALFDLERVPFVYGGIGRLQSMVEEAGQRTLAMGLIGPDFEGPYLCTLKPGVDLSDLGPFAGFEPSVLEARVLRPALGESLGKHVVYLHDNVEAAERVRRGEAQMAFLMKAVPMPLFEQVVSKGQRLPPKSTYFYPKLPTGLVFNSLEGEVS